VRNVPAKKGEILASFGEAARTKIEACASGTSPLNSHLLLRLLQANDLVARSPIPHAPLEIVIVESTEDA